VNVRVQLLADEQREYDRLTRAVARAFQRGLDDEHQTTEAILRKRARVSARASMRVPVAVALVERSRGTRTLVFHESIDQADLIVRQLSARGHSVTTYHTGVGPSVRRDNLRLFRRGVYDVLVSCRALDEGVNLPEAQIAVVASATASERQRIQRLGRVLRPAPGKERALVFTLFATSVEEERLRSEADRLEAADTISWEEARVDRG
jgi:superfamily II DNA or RNA helicase